MRGSPGSLQRKWFSWSEGVAPAEQLAKEQLAGAESSVVEGQNIRRLPRTPRDPTLPFPSSLGLCGWPPREDALEGGLSPSKTPSLEEAPATTCFLEIVRSCAG